MPAAAVIPAPAAYTNIAAVETFVVGPWGLVCRAATRSRALPAGSPVSAASGRPPGRPRAGPGPLEHNPRQ